MSGFPKPAANQPMKAWRQPRLVCIGDLREVAGAQAPTSQLNPGGNFVGGKS